MNSKIYSLHLRIVENAAGEFKCFAKEDDIRYRLNVKPQVTMRGRQTLKLAGLQSTLLSEIGPPDYVKLSNVRGTLQLLVIQLQVASRCQTEQILARILALQIIDLAKNQLT